ncbi:hypothetical protein DID88_002055 [Monilinia fructigena]|uniref:Fructose-bisphosphate aldolase n=1 Tax=Monilinia fructigena TaxID=38457 RepID=A0A395IV80_9HELO|nr:hypothetical protein DID88_002055 [Monilinia fructigena]
MAKSIQDNKAIRMLQAAEDGGYGIVGVVSYNLETITAIVRAAERKRSPAQILLFPWSLHYSPLIHLAAAACRTATVPIVLHMDHAQSEEEKFSKLQIWDSSIEKGIAVEAECGRINGGEDGVKDTGDLEGLLTSPEEALEFVETGVDFLAPAFGNVHGNYGGVENIKLDFDRLEGIRKATNGRVRLVLHGTNTFPDEIMKDCVKGGMTRINLNDLVLNTYNKYIAEKYRQSSFDGTHGEGNKFDSGIN